MAIYFHLYNPQLPISFESIGNDWQQVSLQRMQGHPLYHWLQTEAGAGEVWIEQHKIKLEAGEGILISPFVPHAYYPLSDNWCTNFVTFDGSLKKHFHEMFTNQSFRLAQDSSAFSFSETISQMIAFVEDETQQLALSVLSYQFLLQLGQAQEPLQDHELFQKYVAPSLKLMQSNYAQELTVEMLAQSLFISPQYLGRLFKRFLGQSPYQYLLDFRIRQAKELLINEPDLSIQVIASRVGFDSTSQFIESFKKRTQSTPKKFRALY